MVILRVAMHHASRYEEHHHRGLALRAGVEAAEIEGLLDPAPFEAADPIEAASIRLVDELMACQQDMSDTFEYIAGELGPRGATELAMLIGFYRMVATFIAAIDLQPDALTSVQLREGSIPSGARIE
jgi:alkylhydroperoxidase family enzyme